MKAIERILTVVCLVLVFFAAQAMASGPLTLLAESESISPLGFEGDSNTFYGKGAGNSTTGDDDLDTFIGYRAGYSNTTGDFNTFLGMRAGEQNTTGFCNTFLGSQTGTSNITGSYNTFVGGGAGGANTTGNDNTYLGYYAGISTGTGYANTFLGKEAGASNTTGDNNTFLGSYAGHAHKTGYQNTFLGNHAGYYDNGHYNTFIGPYAGYSHTTGDNNTFLGNWAGYSMTTGSGNVLIGYTAGYNETSLSNKLFIDNSGTSSPLIYGEFDNRNLVVNGNLHMIGPNNGLMRLTDNITPFSTKTARIVLTHFNSPSFPTTKPVYLFGAASTSTANFVAFGGGSTVGNAATQLDFFTAANTATPVGTARITVKENGYVGIGTQTPSQPLQMAGGAYSNGTQWVNASSREYKENIESLGTGEALTTLASLDPVKFNYKADASEKHLGFIAEDVPDLVATKDRKGLSPMDIVAVLTKVVQDLKTENEGLKAKNESLEKRLSVIESIIKASK